MREVTELAGRTFRGAALSNQGAENKELSSPHKPSSVPAFLDVARGWIALGGRSTCERMGKVQSEFYDNMLFNAAKKCPET